jgi:thiol-disulfide isomerase/thioredoxin
MTCRLALCEECLTLVTFTGFSWCPPCKRIHPELLAFQQLKNRNAHYYNVDVQRTQRTEEETQLLDYWDIDSFPSLIVYDPKSKKFYDVEARTAADIDKVLKEILKAKGKHLKEHKVDFKGCCVVKCAMISMK